MIIWFETIESMWKRDFARIIPICFVTGAAIELFMINTGFYRIVTIKEGERRAVRAQEEAAKQERLRQLGLFENKEDI